MRLYEATGGSILEKFSLKDLTTKDLEQALDNGGYPKVKIEKSSFSTLTTKDNQGASHLAMYTVTYADDGSFDSDKQRTNQKLFISLDRKTGKIYADF